MYPKDFPLAESVEIVQILRQKKTAEKLPIFAHNLWIVQGYAMKAALGDPTVSEAPLISFSAKAEAGDSPFDAVAELEKINASVANDGIATQAAVPWALILKWAVQELVVVLAAA